MSYGYDPRQGGQGRRGINPRLLIALAMAVIAILGYFGKSQINPITGRSQRVALSTDEEIALGLHAAPEMMAQHGGELPDQRAQRHVDAVGERLLRALDATLEERNAKNPFQFDFHLLSDPQTINAFALPGGQVFITAALYNRFETEGQLAGVLGHEIGHVLSRHGAQQLAKQQLTQGLVGAAGVAGGDANSARMAAAVAQLVNLKYGREAELESDEWGVQLMTQAGYDPYAMLGVMDILEKASEGGGPPEFMSTHPKPANRKQYIEQVIKSVFPQGVPQGLEE